MKINPTTTKAQFLEIHLSEQEAAELAEQLKDEARKGQDPTQDQQKINLMIAGLGDKRGLIRRTFAESLGLVGKAAVPGLTEVLMNSKNVTARRAAAKTLKLVGESSALPYLYKALMNDADPVVQGSCAGAMAIFGESAIDYLLQVLINPKSSAMQCGLASWAIAFAGSEAPNSLKKASKSQNAKIRAAAIGAIGNQTNVLKDVEVSKILINALNDPISEIRAEATRLIINIRDKELLESLLSMKLEDEDLLVRKNSVLSLMAIRSKKLIPKLKDMIKIEKDKSIIKLINLAIEKIERS